MDLIHLYDNIGEWYHGDRGMPQKMNRKLDNELATLLYRHAPFGSVSIAALLGVALYFFWGKLPTATLLSWAGASFFFSTALTIAAWRYFRLPPAEVNGKLWINRYTYLLLLQDVVWGMIGPMSFMVDDEIYRMLTLFMLGGMSAGAIASRGAVFKTYVVCIVSLLTPIIITLFIQGDSVSEGMLLLTLIYLLFMLSVAKSYSANVRKNILLWIDNEKLVGELRRSKAEVEEANQILLSEIEQRKKIEDELVGAKEDAEQASMAKNQFLANVSHELRTPLNGIIGFTSIMEKEPLSEEHHRYIGQIGKSANTLLRIVNDILDITSIEAGHLKLYEEAFSLRTEVGEVLAILRPMAQRKKLKLDCTIDEDVVDWLHGDANRLRQIISNLLSNALKYTDEGSVSLHVTQRGERDGKPLLHFDVEDTGIGIADEEMATLFDTFTRVEGFETRHNDGVGLGLAIVHNLLKQMGGDIAVKSKPGEGSCFSFELPFEYGVVLTEHPPAAMEVDVQSGNLKHLKVLVVDDNDVNRLVLTTFLRHNEIQYQEAGSGGEALDLIDKHDFDIVLLDIQMPDISGIDVARQVMSMERDIPTLIAVTAHAFPEQRETIINAGFSDFLIKPISEDGLINMLAKVSSGGRGGRAGQRVSV